MSIKILGGVARNFDLATPHSKNTRPTSVMLKRRLFDSVQDFSHIVFVDLCAGSGAIGLEALSRGAQSVMLIESNKNAFRLLKQNAQNIRKKFPELGKVVVKPSDFKRWLKQEITELNKLQDKLYIFFDPPYEQVQLYDDFFAMIKGLEVPAKLVVEACQQKTMKFDQFAEKYGEPDKIFEQGTSFFAIYDL